MWSTDYSMQKQQLYLIKLPSAKKKIATLFFSRIIVIIKIIPITLFQEDNISGRDARLTYGPQ